MLRKKGVVGKFVEFYGAGLSALSVADRATIANMAPEYGATIGFFPVDDGTLNICACRTATRTCRAGRSVFEGADAVPHRRHEGSGFLRHAGTRSGERGAVDGRPEAPAGSLTLPQVKKNFSDAFKDASRRRSQDRDRRRGARWERRGGDRGHHQLHQHVESIGDDGRGLLAKKAVEKGLKSKPWVKTSLAPGSKVVTEYLDKAGLTPYLEALNFNLVGYGCTTCIGNSGPLPEAVPPR
jgi:aconitate hydratase